MYSKATLNNYNREETFMAINTASKMMYFSMSMTMCMPSRA